MLQIIFSFNEQCGPPPGFDLGNLEIRGEVGEATSKGRAPNQSMMVILSVVELLDGIRRFLYSSKIREYRFIGVDCSFCISFQKAAGKINVCVDDHVLHVSSPSAIKRDIEMSILDFVNTNHISSSSNEAEANDLKAAIEAFADFGGV